MSSKDGDYTYVSQTGVLYQWNADADADEPVRSGFWPVPKTEATAIKKHLELLYQESEAKEITEYDEQRWREAMGL